MQEMETIKVGGEFSRHREMYFGNDMKLWSTAFAICLSYCESPKMCRGRKSATKVKGGPYIVTKNTA